MKKNQGRKYVRFTVRKHYICSFETCLLVTQHNNKVGRIIQTPACCINSRWQPDNVLSGGRDECWWSDCQSVVISHVCECPSWALTAGSRARTYVRAQMHTQETRTSKYEPTRGICAHRECWMCATFSRVLNIISHHYGIFAVVDRMLTAMTVWRPFVLVAIHAPVHYLPLEPEPPREFKSVQTYWTQPIC